MLIVFPVFKTELFNSVVRCTDYVMKECAALVE